MLHTQYEQSSCFKNGHPFAEILGLQWNTADVRLASTWLPLACSGPSHLVEVGIVCFAEGLEMQAVRHSNDMECIRCNHLCTCSSSPSRGGMTECLYFCEYILAWLGQTFGPVQTTQTSSSGQLMLLDLPNSWWHSRRIICEVC